MADDRSGVGHSIFRSIKWGRHATDVTRSLRLAIFDKEITCWNLRQKPWYSRFQSPATLSLPGEHVQSGKGILEYYELK